MSKREGEPERRPGSRYTTLVGIAFLALAVYATLNQVRTEEGGLLGANEAERGAPLAEFAVPDVRSGLQGDANVFADDCETPQNPCPPESRRTPACEIREPGAIRVCDLFDRPLAISFWFTRGGECLEAQDAFDGLAARYEGRVNFLSVNVRDEIAEVRDIVAERGWSVPVGWDRDGAVSNVYRVGGCPTVALAYPGGILHGAIIGSEAGDPERLASELDGLVRASERREAVE